MVLGLDDFNHEFTYLDARDRRIARDLLGSGVISGLRVSIDVDARRGPRVVVAPGEAVTPSGRFVAVVPSQCAYLNEWLAPNRPQVEGIASPPEASVRLAVVASWQQAQTDQVPIPGEPCRSDSELMAPSRLQDSFSLDLRSAPPVALGDQVIRELVAWVRQIPVLDGPDPGLDAFLDRVREAAGLAASPPGELDFLRTPPPPGISIPRGSERQYLDAFLRLWATELRPALGSSARGGEADPGGGSGPLDADADSLVLAELTVPVVHDAVSGAIRLAAGARRDRAGEARGRERGCRRLHGPDRAVRSPAMTAQPLDEPVVAGAALRQVNFFNGRLLTGEDLRLEQGTGAARLARAGRAIGGGIAHGFELVASAASTKDKPA